MKRYIYIAILGILLLGAWVWTGKAGIVERELCKHAFAVRYGCEKSGLHCSSHPWKCLDCGEVIREPEVMSFFEVLCDGQLINLGHGEQLWKRVVFYDANDTMIGDFTRTKD